MDEKRKGLIARLRRAAAIVSLAVPLALGSLGAAPLTTSATAEGDSALLAFGATGSTCTFVSPGDGTTGTCTGGGSGLSGCLVVLPVVRTATLSLTEPSGESVSLQLTVVGPATDGVFVAHGLDGTDPVDGAGFFSVECSVDRATAGQISVSWTGA